MLSSLHKHILCLFLTSGLLIISCTLPEGLKPVSGVEGDLTFEGTWPDSIKAASLIALDDLDLDNPGNHLISYSDPIMPGDTLAHFFIQLKPGSYYLATVGLTVEPVIFAAKLDSFKTAQKLPIVIIENDLIAIVTPVRVKYEEITIINRKIIF